LLGLDGRRWLFAFDCGDELASFDVVAFLNIKMSDTAEGGGTNIDVGLWLDLSRAAYDGDQVLTYGLADDDLGYVGLATVDASGDHSGQNDNCANNQEYLLYAHSAVSLFVCWWVPMVDRVMATLVHDFSG
jgi:hypothetical protein